MLSSFRGDNQNPENRIQYAGNKKMQMVSGTDNRLQEQEVL